MRKKASGEVADENDGLSKMQMKSHCRVPHTDMKSQLVAQLEVSW